MNNVAYHVTCVSNLPSIRKHGLRAGSRWTVSIPLAKYYCESLEFEEDPVILMVPLSSLPVEDRIPDYHSLSDCCIPEVRAASGLSTTEEACDAWEKSEQDWQASLNLTSAFGMTSLVAPEHLLVMSQDWRDSHAEAMSKSIH